MSKTPSVFIGFTVLSCMTLLALFIGFDLGLEAGEKESKEAAWQAYSEGFEDGAVTICEQAWPEENCQELWNQTRKE